MGSNPRGDLPMHAPRRFRRSGSSERESPVRTRSIRTSQERYISYMIHTSLKRDKPMRFHDSLDLLFSDPSHLRVLRALWRSSSEHLTGREVATRAKVSTAQTARTLKDLQDVGLVSSQAAGRAFVWRWNQDHVWAGPVQRLFEAEARLPADLLRDVSGMLKGLPIERARLFGSVSRGRERVDSDIDLFVETPNAYASENVRSRLNRVRVNLWRKYGNPLSLLVLTSREVRRRSGVAFLETIEKEGIPLGG